jgi:diadenosine tetraphosphate (Ap4A) HIT family hydrolase
MIETCFSCQQTARGAALPCSERIYNDGLWRVAHAFNSALPGWLVVIPHRHIETLAALTAAEAGVLGPLLQHLSAALTEVIGCPKTYVVMFAEKVQHVHFHVIPRMADLPANRSGDRIFDYLRQPETAWVSQAERDRIGMAVAETLRR